MSERSKFPGLDDLALKIEAVAQAHPDYSRAWEVVQACCHHLRAIEGVSRLQRELAACQERSGTLRHAASE